MTYPIKIRFPVIVDMTGLNIIKCNQFSFGFSHRGA